MGGVSGGAARAYSHSVEIPRPWAGIFANGGWLGGRQTYNRAYPPMRVAMVNGDKDDAANLYLDADSGVLMKAGSIVSVHAFEGGHQLAPPSVQAKALRWLLGEDEKPRLP
jgi:predicted esterase